MTMRIENELDVMAELIACYSNFKLTNSIERKIEMHEEFMHLFKKEHYRLRDGLSFDQNVDLSLMLEDISSSIVSIN